MHEVYDLTATPYSFFAALFALIYGFSFLGRMIPGSIGRTFRENPVISSQPSFRTVNDVYVFFAVVLVFGGVTMAGLLTYFSAQY